MARKKEEFCQKVRKHIAKWDNYFKQNNERYHAYNEFTFVQQWDESEESIFNNYNKKPLTVNKMVALLNIVLGEQRDNTPSLEVVPTEDTPVPIANTREAIVKSIMFNSHSRAVFQQAFQQAVVGGYGSLWIDTEYDDNDNFDQNIIMYTVEDPTMCFWDVSAKAVDRTDGLFCGYKVRMSRDMFASQYGDATTKKIKDEKGNDVDKGVNGSIQDLSDETTGFVYNDKDSITVIHYFEKEIKHNKIVEISTGEVISASELETVDLEIDGEILKDVHMYDGELVTIVKSRVVPEPNIIHYKFAGDYELERSEFPAKKLPGVFVDQASITTKDGKMVTRPFLSDIKDLQVYLNYLFTQSAYLVKMHRYDQFMASKENVRSPDTQAIWSDPANIQGALIYDESPTGAKPEQIQPTQITAALTEQMATCMQNIQTSTGIFDSYTGQQGNEVSGVAIEARNHRGSFSTSSPMEKLNHAIWTCGEIINEMIPTVYDTPRTLMLEMNGVPNKPVNINEPVDEYGSQVQNDITEGKFRIYLKPGSSFEGQKREALESLQMILQANPSLFNMIADLYAENLPLANSVEIKNRLKTLVPPNIIQAGLTGESPQQEPEQPPPELMIEIQKVQQKDRELELKQADMMAKIDQSQRDDYLKIEELKQKRIENAAQLEEQMLRYEAEMRRTGADVDIAHAKNLVDLLTHQPRELNHDSKRDR